jgi:hypothetical protein
MEGKHIFREGFRNLPLFSYEGCFIGRGKLSGSVRRAICVEGTKSEKVNGVEGWGGKRTDRF